jgi:alpha-L-fucosidase
MRWKNLFLAGLINFLLLLQTEAQQLKVPVGDGPFKPNDSSLKQYQYPDWFRDAKLGYWSHWGPQAVPRQGDWYARNMYIQNNPDYNYHVAHYGHPSKVGYKDLIPLWKAERWNPEKLMKLFKKAGARYFVSMASHHDNFLLWDSKIQKWNAVNQGPKKDVVGLWQKAAKKEGLKFGVSEHLAASYNWFQTSRGSDKTGPYAGVPYDGNDARYEDLYHTKADSSDIKNWLTNNREWHLRWFDLVTELIDKYKPDLLYSDSKLPFDEVGRSMLAYYYNRSAKDNTRVNVVYTCKEASLGKWVQDVERGVLDGISPYPWQTDTSIGDWYYRTGQKYKTADEIVQLLMDIVSKNGNLLINVVQTPEGDLEPDVLDIMENISKWVAANGEGVYGTRPWRVYGEGPSTLKENQKAGIFGGVSDSRAYQSSDIRYTTKNGNVYAFVMSSPEENIKLTALGKGAESGQEIASVSMLGNKQKLQWKQQDDALVINKPVKLPAWKVHGFKITFRK